MNLSKEDFDELINLTLENMSYEDIINDAVFESTYKVQRRMREILFEFPKPFNDKEIEQIIEEAEVEHNLYFKTVVRKEKIIDILKNRIVANLTNQQLLEGQQEVAKEIIDWLYNNDFHDGLSDGLLSIIVGDININELIRQELIRRNITIN